MLQYVDDADYADAVEIFLDVAKLTGPRRMCLYATS